jgi:hypothetical protein
MTKLLFPILLMGVFANAQIGVNTETPNATFDVVGKPSETNKFDGIIAPRILGDQLKLKNYTSSQTGALVYVTNADMNPSGQTVDVTSSGYYYFNGDLNKWIKIVSGNLLEPWKVQGTAVASTQNTEDIYQQGKVAIGTTSSSAVSTKQLDVAGDFKTKYTDGTNYYGLETNFSDFGIPVNMMYSSNNANLISATESSVVSVYPGMSTLQTNNGLGGGSMATFSNSTGGNFALVANNTDQSVSSSIWGYNDGNASNLYLSHAKTSAESASMTIEKTKGVTFGFSDSAGNVQGSYDFPRTNGSANQVLVTDGSGTSANLSWKDASSLNLKIRTLVSGTVSMDDYTILVSGNISLPAASTSNLGKVYNLINDTAGNVIINGTFRINGGNFSNYGLNNNDMGRGIVVQSTGSAWVIVSRY